MSWSISKLLTCPLISYVMVFRLLPIMENEVCKSRQPKSSLLWRIRPISTLSACRCPFMNVCPCVVSVAEFWK